MKFKVLTIFLAVAICCEATYYNGYAGRYSLGPYGSAGLGYTLPLVGNAPYPYNVQALGYNAVPFGRGAYNYPLNFDGYGIAYDSGSLGLINPGYGGAYLDKGLYSGAFNYPYGPSVGAIGKYGIPLKKR